VSNLAQIANKLVSPKKGIFAADWSVGTATKYFEKNKMESSEENRRLYRQMLFSTPKLEDYVSGVILHTETAYQKMDNGKLIPDYLEEKGIIPGIRADEGYEELEGSEKEKITKGIETLDERLKEYKKLGIKFTKWRAPFFVDEVRPSKESIEKNTDLLVEYAKLSQKNGFVPIVEPEILIDGEHTMSKCETVTTEIQKILFEKLKENGVIFEELLLKPNMILPGKESGVRVSSVEVAGSTLRVLKNSVPSKVPGIVFLSGGQTPEESTENLNEIVKSANDTPWELSFSYARALQNPAIEIYGGKKENIEKAQDALYKRAKLNSLARRGKYKKEMENE